eukprot:Ihof_evm1s509 gene=Ihof_evmTU1s509
MVGSTFAAEPNEIKFDAKPDNQIHTVKLTQGKVQCIFEFSCSGGTDENWLMSLSKDLNTRSYSCIIERPDQKSYLYFTHFKVSLNHLASVDLFSNTEPLSKHEYKVSHEKNYMGI